MKKNVLARELAERRRVKAGNAAEQMERAVNQIIRTLKGGRRAHLPGLGTIAPGKRLTFQQDPNEC